MPGINDTVRYKVVQKIPMLVIYTLFKIIYCACKASARLPGQPKFQRAARTVGRNVRMAMASYVRIAYAYVLTRST